jgi:hypothetical protein
MKEPLNLLKQSLDQLLQADTSIKRKNKTTFFKKKDLFINIVNHYEAAITKSYLLEKDFKIDTSKYEENFHQVIDSFGKEVYQLLSFYFYERINPDGSVNKLVLPNEEELDISNAEELWSLIVKIKPDIFNDKG